jgi:hypothetical protein
MREEEKSRPDQQATPNSPKTGESSDQSADKPLKTKPDKSIKAPKYRNLTEGADPEKCKE